MDEITHPVAPVRPRVVTPLKLALTETGRRQDWLAEQVGTDPAQISDYVRGVHIPRASTRQAIAKTLERQVSELWPGLAKDAA